MVYDIKDEQKTRSDFKTSDEFVAYLEGHSDGLRFAQKVIREMLEKRVM